MFEIKETLCIEFSELGRRKNSKLAITEVGKAKTSRNNHSYCTSNIPFHSLPQSNVHMTVHPSVWGEARCCSLGGLPATDTSLAPPVCARTGSHMAERGKLPWSAECSHSLQSEKFTINVFLVREAIKKITI